MKKLLLFVFLFTSVILNAQSKDRLQSYCNRFKVSEGILIKRIVTTTRDSTFFNTTSIDMKSLYLFKDNGDWVLFNCGNCTILCPNKINIIVYDDRLRVIIDLEGGDISVDYVWN
jgi:hypothetical protein